MMNQLTSILNRIDSFSSHLDVANEIKSIIYKNEPTSHDFDVACVVF